MLVMNILKTYLRIVQLASNLESQPFCDNIP